MMHLFCFPFTCTKIAGGEDELPYRLILVLVLMLVVMKNQHLWKINHSPLQETNSNRQHLVKTSSSI